MRPMDVASVAFGWGAAIEFVSIAEISELLPPWMTSGEKTKHVQVTYKQHNVIKVVGVFQGCEAESLKSSLSFKAVFPESPCDFVVEKYQNIPLPCLGLQDDLFHGWWQHLRNGKMLKVFEFEASAWRFEMQIKAMHHEVWKIFSWSFFLCFREVRTQSLLRQLTFSSPTAEDNLNHNCL